MKENLVQTSSIFSSKGKEDHPTELSETIEVHSEEELDFNTGEFARCRILNHDDSKPRDTISLVKLFPDSKISIMYNPYHESYFVGCIPQEHLFDVPFTEYAIVLVTTEMVILKIKPLDSEQHTHMVIEAGEYSLVDEPDFEVVESKFIEYKEKTYSLETSETTKAKSINGGKSVIFSFEKYQINVLDNKHLIYIDSKDGHRLLLADDNGFYFGFYLKLDSDGAVNLGGNKYRMVGRPSLTIAMIQEIGENEELFLLTCRKQMILSLSDFLDSSYETMEVRNGIALLFEEQNGSSVMNIFTPNHQQIILEPKYKIDFDSIGNGVYFRRDGVVLLENGSLTFVQKGKKKNQIIMKDRVVELPIRYLGDL